MDCIEESNHWFLAAKLSDNFTESLNACYSTACLQGDLPKQSLTRIPRLAFNTILRSVSSNTPEVDSKDQLSLAAEQCSDGEILSALEPARPTSFLGDINSHMSDDSD